MTALRFQTDRRDQTSPASLRGVTDRGNYTVKKTNTCTHGPTLPHAPFSEDNKLFEQIRLLMHHDTSVNTDEKESDRNITKSIMGRGD